MPIPNSTCRGFSLIEVVIFIVIISVGIAGILSVFNVSVMHSADPMVQKQAQAFAEGLLEEIQTGAYAYCDGADDNLAYATTVAGCTTADTYDSESGESRPYDTVKDYGSAKDAETEIAATDLSGTIAAPSGYTAKVTISEVTLQGAEALLIKVKVSGPGNTTAIAEGFKVRQRPL